MELEGFTLKLNQMNKLITKKINDNLIEYNITRSEVPYLIELNKKNLTQEQLSKKLNYNESTITRAMTRLEKKELIIRIQDENDKRKRIVQLTDKGKLITNEIILKQKKSEEHILNNLTDEEKKVILKLINRLIK